MIALFINYVFIPLPEPLVSCIPLFYLKLLLGYSTIKAPRQSRPPARPLSDRERAEMQCLGNALDDPEAVTVR